MKLIDLSTYEDSKNVGWCVDILKFSQRSVITLECEESYYRDLPSILLQIGPSDLFSLSLGCIKFHFTINLWSRHYDT